ncbi:hypothetical protein NEAUS04_1098 [Nematocida ausubeli]|nr:hypothetical protein NEAUS05_1408 [Nematocida ausubeli]KAI5162699.1 hypothetical protein NEAUS04_1098 [Nematocida ausubeli]
MNTAASLDRLAYELAGSRRTAFYPILEKHFRTKELLENSVSRVRIYVMKMYCLCADGDISMGSYMYSKIKGDLHLIAGCNVEMIMARESLLIVNQIDELIEHRDIFNFKSIYNFNLSLLKNDLEECKDLSLKLTKTHPSCAMVLLLKGTGEIRGLQLEILKVLLRKVRVSNSLISLLLAKGIPYASVLQKYVLDNITKKENDISSLLLLKDLVLRGIPIEEYGYTIDSLLEKLDDWEIYEYCLENDIQIQKKDNKSINYLTYELSLSMEPERILRYVRTSHNFSFLFKNMEGMDAARREELLQSVKHSDPLRFLYLNDAKFEFFSKEGCLEIRDFRSYLNNMTDLIFLVGILIKEKRDEGIVQALLILLVKRNDFPGNQYITMLICGLLRYLLAYELFTTEYEKLDVQNIQLESLSYLWSDLQILYETWLRIKLPEDLTESYLSNRLIAIGSANTNMFNLTEREEYSQLLALLSYRDRLINSPTYKQITEGKLYPLEKTPNIEKILISESRYIFAKVTSRAQKGKGSSAFVTLDSIPELLDTCSIRKIFQDSLNKISAFMPVPHDVSSIVDRIIYSQEIVWNALQKSEQMN